VHPAFISFIEHELGRGDALYQLPAALTPLHLPSLKAAQEIGEYLKVSHLLIRSMLLRPERHYRTFWFKKKTGSDRRIDSPRTFLKVVQWWILDTILYNCTVSTHSHGFIPGRSFLSNAKAHFGARHVLNVDIKDFFPSITTSQVQGLFESLGYSELVSADLAGLTTYNGSLPQGAPTSPMIANILMNPVDDVLGGYARQNEYVYTRYADDLTFSSQNRISEGIVDVIRSALLPLNFDLNGRKSRFMGPNDRKEVTGLILGLNDVRLSPQFLNAARGWFHSAFKNPAQYVPHKERIRGTVALIEQVRGAGSAKVALIGRQALGAIEGMPL
jgi:hypothetical protein